MSNTTILSDDSTLILVDRQNRPCGEIKYIDSLPSYRETLDRNGIKQIRVLIGESLKSIANIPNKTLEVRFNPEIAKGLENGNLTLLKTKNGELLADAIDKSGKIAGKGRINSNISNQLTSAGFQLISFAVAQSHLQDITCHLNKIQNLCESIKDQLDRKDLTDMEATSKYLEGIIDKIKIFSDPISISEIQRSHIEGSIKDFIKYRISIVKEFESLINKIATQKDEDRWGTEETYCSLKEKQLEYYNIIHKLEYLNKIFILLKMIISYIDPNGKTFSLVNNYNDFEFLRNLQSEYIKKTNDTIDRLLSNATFNARDTLELRKGSLKLESKIQDNLFDRINENRDEILSRINKHLEILNKPKEIRYALNFDENGEIKEAVLI